VVPSVWPLFVDAKPPVCNNSFSFRLALFVLDFVVDRSLVDPTVLILLIEQFDENGSNGSFVVGVEASAKTSKIEDQTLGIRVTDDPFFWLSSSIESILSLPWPPFCQSKDLVFRDDNNVVSSIAASTAFAKGVLFDNIVEHR